MAQAPRSSTACPWCGKPRRYLYRLKASDGKLVDYFGLQCQVCSKLRWASQGRYRNKLERAFVGAVASVYGLSGRRPLPRRPWDPRAVSEPQIVAEEFAEQARRKPFPLADWAKLDFGEFLQAKTEEQMRPPALPGNRWPRRRLAPDFPTQQDQRAVEAVWQVFALHWLFAGDAAHLRGMWFLHRVLG
jgi:hypothetical protein